LTDRDGEVEREGWTATQRRPDAPPRIAFLLGKPLRRGVVLAGVRDLLEANTAAVAVHVPDGDDPLPSWLFASDLVVQRGLGLPELTAARALERAGVRCCNRVAATMGLRDRHLMSEKLAAGGVAVPETVVAARWSDVVDTGDGRGVVVKRADGSAGRGVGVFIAATGHLPAQAPFGGPYVVQEYIPSDERDYKVYVAGSSAAGLVKRWSPAEPAGPAVPFAVDKELGELARLVGKALDLEIYGVDVLFGPHGPVVVDVNPFPGFRGVSGAAPLIADHLTAILPDQERD